MILFYVVCDRDKHFYSRDSGLVDDVNAATRFSTLGDVNRETKKIEESIKKPISRYYAEFELHGEKVLKDVLSSQAFDLWALQVEEHEEALKNA